MNPCIINDGGQLLGIIRNVNYTFYHSERQLFLHPFGPLTYLHPENDVNLRTQNWYVEFDDELEITRFDKIDTSAHDIDPVWTFIGLEDARLVRWNGRLYTTGVRRDVKPNGEGRMELCEIEVGTDSVREVSRWRIPAPGDDDTYCEKNWMPILDHPYHYVKWSNPTEVVHADPENGTCTTTTLTDQFQNVPLQMRGGSPVIPWGEDYIACTHEVNLFKSEVGRKNAVYTHRFVIWDKNWNIKTVSPQFNFLDGLVEFCVGMCHWQDRVLLTFGFQDNAAYILSTDQDTINGFIHS